MSTAAEKIDRALRLTGLSLGELAAQLGLKEATLYKARGGHIALSGRAEKAIEHFVARSVSKEAAALANGTAFLRRQSLTEEAKKAAVPFTRLAEQLSFIHEHATTEELRILAGTLEAFHAQAAERQRRGE